MGLAEKIKETYGNVTVEFTSTTLNNRGALSKSSAENLVKIKVLNKNKLKNHKQAASRWPKGFWIWNKTTAMGKNRYGID